VLTGGQDISKRCPQKFLGSSVTNRYIPFSQKANERIRDLGELIRNLYQQWGVICIELFRSNTPKSLCCKEFSQLVPLSAVALSIEGLPAFRKPASFGGTGKDPLWQIDDSHITGDLQAVQDSPTHVSIMPRVTMALEKYEAALANTQKYWEKVD